MESSSWGCSNGQPLSTYVFCSRSHLQEAKNRSLHSQESCGGRCADQVNPKTQCHHLAQGHPGHKIAGLSHPQLLSWAFSHVAGWVQFSPRLSVALPQSISKSQVLAMLLYSSPAAGGTISEAAPHLPPCQGRQGLERGC
jgi:hypothetical protein